MRYSEEGPDVIDGGQVDTAEVASSIRPELERQMQEQVPDATVSVQSIDCVAASDSGGSCIAKLNYDLGNSQTVSISFTVDRDTGEFVWTTE